MNNNTQLVDLSMTEMLTVSGGDDLDQPKVKCYLLGAAVGASLVVGGWALVGGAYAAYTAYDNGCLTLT